MKAIRNSSWVFALLALPLADANGAQPISPQRAVASGRNDVVYLAPATEPYEALPLGNGTLGVMVRNQGASRGSSTTADSLPMRPRTTIWSRRAR